MRADFNRADPLQQTISWAREICPLQETAPVTQQHGHTGPSISALLQETSDLLVRSASLIQQSLKDKNIGIRLGKHPINELVSLPAVLSPPLPSTIIPENDLAGFESQSNTITQASLPTLPSIVAPPTEPQLAPLETVPTHGNLDLWMPQPLPNWEWSSSGSDEPANSQGLTPYTAGIPENVFTQPRDNDIAKGPRKKRQRTRKVSSLNSLKRLSPAPTG